MGQIINNTTIYKAPSVHEVTTRAPYNRFTWWMQNSARRPPTLGPNIASSSAVAVARTCNSLPLCPNMSRPHPLYVCFPRSRQGLARLVQTGSRESTCGLSVSDVGPEVVLATSLVEVGSVFRHSSGILCRDFYTAPFVTSACAVTVVIFRHFNRSFFT